MNPQKAIEISTRIINERLNFYADDEKTAIKLGIEALKRLALMRENPGMNWHTYLPGETQD